MRILYVHGWYIKQEVVSPLKAKPKPAPPPNQSYDVRFPPFVSLTYTLPAPPPHQVVMWLKFTTLPPSSPHFPPFVCISHIKRHIA